MSKSPKAAATGTITAAIENTLDTMEAANTKLHALTQITRESALAEARLADARVAAGAAHGLLHGMPVGIKDIADVEGLVSGCGSLTRKQAEPARKDAHVVTKLRTAGAIVAGKTHTVEYAFGGYGTNVTVGTPWNPWDLKVHRIPGGSSSGTGSMVGAGVLPGGLRRLGAHSCCALWLRRPQDLDRPERALGDRAALADARYGRPARPRRDDGGAHVCRHARA